MSFLQAKQKATATPEHSRAFRVTWILRTSSGVIPLQGLSQSHLVTTLTSVFQLKFSTKSNAVKAIGWMHWKSSILQLKWSWIQHWQSQILRSFETGSKIINLYVNVGPFIFAFCSQNFQSSNMLTSSLHQ